MAISLRTYADYYGNANNTLGEAINPALTLFLLQAPISVLPR